MELKLVLVTCLCLCVTQIHSSNDKTERTNAKEFDVKLPDHTRIKHKTIESIKSHFSENFMPTMCNLTQHSREITVTPPWIPAKYSYRSGVDGLHTEIEHFNAYMRATSTEHTLRIQVVRRIESIVLQVWSTARVQVFGSYRSGMFLPNSDIDLDVSRVLDRFPLRVLEAKLLASNIAEPNSIVVIEKTRVPIIKFIDRANKLKVDISINNYGVIRKIDLINEYKRKYPVLSKLVIVLKQFLLLYDLNESHTGGVASFALAVMCINFLQLQSTNKVGENANLGVLLLEFLELYGKKFDYDTNCVRITNGGQYSPKKKALSLMIHDHRTKFLCIEDPLDPRINLAHTSKSMPKVKCAFAHAFTLLSNAMSPIQNRCDRMENKSTLSRIVQVTKKLVKYRNWVSKTFE